MTLLKDAVEDEVLRAWQPSTALPISTELELDRNSSEEDDVTAQKRRFLMRRSRAFRLGKAEHCMALVSDY